MKRALRATAHLFRSAAAGFDRLAGRAAPMADPAAGAELVRRAAAAHDMAAHPDEPYFASQYLHWIKSECASRFPSGDPVVLDVGCGQGRLAMPLAQWASRGRVRGVDFTPEAVRRASESARALGLANAEFVVADALAFMRAEPEASCDVVLLLEVAFVLPAYRAVLAEARRVLREGGLLFASFRGRYFNVLHAVRIRDWDGARLAMERREGDWAGTGVWFSWHTRAEAERCVADAGFRVVATRGIGVASGIEGDPLAAIARPSELAPAERETLQKLECALADEYAECGRYILVTAEKPRPA